MIKIIQGTYGHREGAKIVAKTPADDPFGTTPEQEERLVKLGVAVYVETKQSTPEPPKAPEPPKTPEPPKDPGVPADPGTGSGSENVDKLPEYNAEMKLDELKEIAKAYGVDASSAYKKVDVIAKIEAAKKAAEDQDDEDPDDETPEGDDDGEAPPTIGAADPVI